MNTTRRPIIATCQDQRQEELLGMLKKHFPRTTAFEKHPNAMISILCQRAVESALGKNFRKERISQRKEKKLYDSIVHQLRINYGKWINLTNFRVKSPWEIKFNCNLTHSFKNDMGTLFTQDDLFGDDIFYTEHSFERFEERANPESKVSLGKFLTKRLNAIPTIADMVFYAVHTTSYAYGLESVQNAVTGEPQCFVHLDLFFGSLVLEDFSDFFIAKTYLDGAMARRSGIQWYQPQLTDEEFLDRPFQNLRDIVEKPATEIGTPDFTADGFMRWVEDRRAVQQDLRKAREELVA